MVAADITAALGPAPPEASRRAADAGGVPGEGAGRKRGKQLGAAGSWLL
ncbi:MAG TPA: hypothetical protein VGP04_16535 [Pseudonocardiaceae bacterium]|nr:hypothetical protein [Pseudonocardiaceae bacterium]